MFNPFTVRKENMLLKKKLKHAEADLQSCRKLLDAFKIKTNTLEEELIKQTGSRAIPVSTEGENKDVTP